MRELTAVEGAPIYHIAKQLGETLQQLEAAKLREAELASALEIARGWLSSTENDVEVSQMNPVERLSVAIKRINKALNAMLDPSAALAERDRAIVARALAAIDLARGKEAIYATIYAHSIRREFGLDHEPEGE